MNSLTLTGIRKFEFKEKQKPTIRSTSAVLLQIRNVGICGSDIHYYKSGKIGDQIIKFPFTIGHEASAIVEST
ncbi:MAG: alcohol dehydrogenase catalytic domain-containing protein, partial [candidate division WOR-3 bacterium]